VNSIAIFAEIVRITLRQLLGRRRTLLLVLLSALPVVLALAFRLGGETEIERFTRRIFDTITMTILLPLVAILFGSGAFGAEIDDGTVVYLLAKPIPRWLVIAAKASGAIAMSIVLTGTSTLLAGFIDLAPAGADGIHAVLAQFLAVVVGSACYVALFLALSLFTRRALVIGIGYMLVWEGALSFILTGIRNGLRPIGRAGGRVAGDCDVETDALRAAGGQRLGANASALACFAFGSRSGGSAPAYGAVTVKVQVPVIVAVTLSVATTLASPVAARMVTKVWTPPSLAVNA